MLFCIYLFLLRQLFFLQRLSIHCEILIRLMSQFPSTFHRNQKAMYLFITQLLTILVLTGTVPVITWEIFHGKKSLNLVLRFLLPFFWADPGWDYVYIPHPKYQLKPHSSAWFSAAYAATIVCTSRINLHHLKWNSDVVIVARGFLEHVTLANTNKTNSSFFSENFWNSRHFILINVQIFL